MTFGNGDLCYETSSDKLIARTVSIDFFCDRDLKGMGEPTLTTGGHNACSQNFVWTTRFACELKDQISTDCSKVETKLGYNVDLSQLGTADNGMYSLNLCGDVTCGNERASVCFDGKAIG